MPKLTDQDKQMRHANFSNVKFAKRFALLYRKNQLHNTFGRTRHLKHFKFIKDMKRKYGYYQHQESKIRTSDKYYDRLNPEKWSKSRLMEWGEENYHWFEKVTTVKRKQKKRKKKHSFSPKLPKSTNKMSNKNSKQQYGQGLSSIIPTIATLAVIIYEKLDKIEELG